MSGARRRSKSSWDNKEESMPQSGKIPKDFDSSFHGHKHGDTSNSEAIDVLTSDDFSHDPSMQPNENIPYRGGNRNRDRSRSPHRNRTRDRGGGDERERRESYRQHGGSRFRDDRNKDSDSYRKDKDKDRDRGNNSMKSAPCRFYMMGNCNRNRCKFSHDVPINPIQDGYEQRSHDYTNAKSNRNLDEKNKSWNDLESMGNQDFTQNPVTLNGDEKSPEMNEGEKLLEASRSKEEDVPSSLPEKQILANALELLYSLPNPSVPVDSQEQGNQIPVEMESKQEENEKKEEENETLKNTNNNNNNNNNTGKNEKVEEGDEKAMRQFKVVLVEFVKEILKPTWKEGKMGREVYKTIVKKVVEKVSSSIQGVQIPRTQEKIDQYLAFSKSKITKLVEAYVGRLAKA
ncbi:hypothetical protein LXL04_029931 [Taraxacum kok-saghyz]